MSLTDKEKVRRRNDPNVQYITEHICRHDTGRPYVFISYKSDEWERVLGDIVHKLVKEYGLNVYFDGDFNGHNPLWTEQFPKNMEADNCRGILAFVDDFYTTSYATLLELLYSQVGCQQSEPPYDTIPKPVITINLGKLTVIHDKSDTGLGAKAYEDGEANIHWKDEKELFEELFMSAKKSGIINNTVKPYQKSKILSRELCSAMFKEVLGYIRANDNFIDAGVTLEDIVNKIKNECGEDVFDRSDIVSPSDVVTTDDGKKENKEESYEDREKIISTAPNNTTEEESESDEEKRVTLETVKIISDGSIFHIKGRDGAYDAFYRKKGDRYIVLKGSRVKYHENWTPKRLWKQYENKITEEGILLCDINDLLVSTAAKLIEGTSTSGKELESNENIMAKGESYEVSFDPYRIVANTGTTTSGGEVKKVIENGLVDVDLPQQTVRPVISRPVIAPKPLIEVGDEKSDSIDDNNTKKRKISLVEMIDQGILLVGDEVYVKNHPNAIGTLSGGNSIRYNGKELSLNQFVPEILGPGSRNAYTYVYHKKTNKTLDELRP